MGHAPTVSAMRMMCIAVFALTFSAWSQTTNIEQRLRNVEQALSFVVARLEKRVNDLLWIRELEEIAGVDKVRFTGPSLPP